jgi:hypothetical protein
MPRRMLDEDILGRRAMQLEMADRVLTGWINSKGEPALQMSRYIFL